MIECTRTNSENKDFRDLVSQLDLDLSIRDGADHSFYAQFNKIDAIKCAVVAYSGGQPVGCGAIKQHSDQAMEVKRMFVLHNRRGQGIASAVLKELEKWAGEQNYKKCVLETGQKQPEAIALYKKHGYKIIPNFGQYKDVANSICFEKEVGE